MTKWVYEFSEGSRDMRELLGGKGANVAEMKRIGGPVRVPDGFTITTAACVAYMKENGQFPDGLESQVDEALARLEEQTGKRLGDPGDPLLVSVRSGARESMPGMLDTVLNLGLNDDSLRGLIERTGNERFGWDSYRRFVQMFGSVVRGMDGDLFESPIKALKERSGAELDTDLDARALEQLTGEFKQIFAAETGEEFPQDPREQLRQAICAIFDSWNGERAVHYRRLNRIPDEWGTAVNVQQMVFGNMGDTSASGVAFSRNQTTGAPEPSGDFLQNAQGEDVVSGVRNTRDLSELAELLPEVHAQLTDIMRTLERHYRDMQDIEFTIEDGTLYMLQTRNAKRPAQAAVRVAVDMVDEGVLTREEALMRIDANKLEELLHPTFDPSYSYTPLARGVPASPGAAKGSIVFTASEAVEQAEDGREVILVRPFTEAEDVAGFHAARGILTSEGGKASHAALVARGMGRPCVAGASRLRIDLEARTVSVDGTRLSAGDLIAIDGTRGLVTIEDVPLVAPEISEQFDTVLEWSDAVRRLGVRANADTPADARRAREFGAEGIGLCRTEHMFMEAERQPKMRAMIMADTEEDRRAALEELLPFQRGDFEGLFEAMDDRPVTIRLLDPPLHEFLPSKSELLVERERLRRSDDAKRIEELEHLLARVRDLEEVNPMLGTRGCRLAVLYPEVYEMQVRAIVGAAQAVRERTGKEPTVEIMIPLVGYEQELEQMRALVERAAAPFAVSVGTMIELPRACMIADLIARSRRLLQLRHERPDADGAGFLARRRRGRVPERVPRAEDPGPQPVRDARPAGSRQPRARRGGGRARSAQPNLKLGICGEHGGDPDSIDFFDEAGLDYVSCSPFRVPIARVAAAQAAIRHRE